QGRIGRGLRILALAGIFGAGYLCGSLGQRSAEAQLGDVMKKAGEQGGALGSIGQLGSSIVEMQQHVDGLNKDRETLRKATTGLGPCSLRGSSVPRAARASAGPWGRSASFWTGGTTIDRDRPLFRNLEVRCGS